jgi:hypothetical protein
LGNKIIHRKISQGEILLEIDLSSLSDGFYFLDLEYQNKPFLLEKIVKVDSNY